MSNPSLSERVSKVENNIRSRVARLEPNDPAKDWFTLELESLSELKDGGEDLSESGAQLSALKQLSHLVQLHFIKLLNPQDDSTAANIEASLLTVRARQPQEVLKSAREMRFSIEPSLLHDPTNENEQFDPVSPTAKVVGYLRGLDRSLKITEELSMETQGGSLMNELGITDAETQASMAVYFRADTTHSMLPSSNRICLQCKLLSSLRAFLQGVINGHR